LTADQFILRVNIDNPWFQRRSLSVVSHANFDGDSIASIYVDMTYNGVTQGKQITTAATPQNVSWDSQLVRGQMVREISYTYTVYFKNVDTTQRPGSIVSTAATVIGDVLSIEPRGDLYGVTTIPIRAYDLPFDRYPNVEVECRYVDQPNGINLEASAILTAQAPEVDWPMFMRDASKRSFDYRLTYSLATGGTSVTPWTTTTGGKIDIVDPFPSKIRLTVIPAVNWTQVPQCIVFVAYPSKENPITQQTYFMNATNSAPQTFIAERQDKAQNLVYYEAQLVRQNGSVWSIPPSETGNKSLIIQDGQKGHQILTIAPEQVDFATNRITNVQVQVQYVDSTHSISVGNTFKFLTASDATTFEFDYLTAGINPQYRADIALDNGQTRTIDWTPITGDTLTIPLSQMVS
jgi:hypothetical protein